MAIRLVSIDREEREPPEGIGIATEFRYVGYWAAERLPWSVAGSRWNAVVPGREDPSSGYCFATAVAERRDRCSLDVEGVPFIIDTFAN